MALARCPECGLPRRLSRHFLWTGNGAIISRRDPNMRMVFFEADYYPYIWEELENRLGVSISEIYVRGQRASVRDYVEENVLYGWRRMLVRSLPFSAVIRRVVEELALFGFGHLELVEYKRHRMVLVRVTNPFDILSLAWGSKGFFELVEGKPAEMAWYREGEGYLLTAVPASETLEHAEPDREALRALREAKRKLSDVRDGVDSLVVRKNNCRRCGLPLMLTDLEWREEEGAIYHRKLGRRFIFSSGHVLVVLMQELERLTGQDLDWTLLEITRNYHLRSMPDLSQRDKAEVYYELVNRLHAWGYGIPVDYSFGAGHLEMTIANPFYPPRVVGYVAAFFESLEGLESEIEYRLSGSKDLDLEIRTG